jgi:hypothetical protein
MFKDLIRLLPLALLMLAAAPASADPRVVNFAGVWKGPVSTTPNGCTWQVTANVVEKEGFALGNFSYSGPCAKGLQTGTFRARPTSPACYQVDAGVPGMPKMQFTACFNDDGSVTFDSLLVKGSVKLSEKNRKAALSSTSLLGGASGTLLKTMAPPPGKGAKKKTPAVKPVTLQRAGTE